MALQRNIRFLILIFLLSLVGCATQYHHPIKKTADFNDDIHECRSHTESGGIRDGLGAAYRDSVDKGGIDARTKELLGLVASTALRCNDCIDYHLEQCVELGWTLQEIEDALNVAMIVGGSITIPHLRHAKLTLEELFAERS